MSAADSTDSTYSADTSLIDQIRAASRLMVRELGFMQNTLAATDYAASAVHALLETGSRKRITAAQLSEFLGLEKSSVSRMVRKLVDADELREEACDDDGRVKWLVLTARGKRTVARITAFGRDQVAGALAQLAPQQQQAASHGLSVYAQALARRRMLPGEADRLIAAVPVEVVAGYQPGALGRMVQMQAEFYARSVGFGSFFESKVAAGLAQFLPRLTQSCNGLWLAVQAGRVIGAVAIDGEDLGERRAHLRWFIVDDGVRGAGVGKRLLAEALAFCDMQGFASVQLWTFEGLAAARRLYEMHGFRLVEQWTGEQWGKAMVEQRFERIGNL